MRHVIMDEPTICDGRGRMVQWIGRLTCNVYAETFFRPDLDVY